MSYKSNTCFSKRDGSALSTYESQEEADNGANYANEKYQRDLKAYICDKCNLWHLSPKDRETPNSICKHCTDGENKPKALYQTEGNARRRAEILYNEKAIRLNIYKCEYSEGWHLTKS